MNLLVSTKDLKKKKTFPQNKENYLSIECAQSYFLKPTYEIQRLYRH